MATGIATKKHLKPLRNAGAALHRRGDEYNLGELDELEEEAETASSDQVYKGIDYLVKLLGSKSIDYGLMDGIAMQLYGIDGRETHDGDMAISVNSANLIDVVKDDPNIRRPGKLMGASGTARLFVKIDEQQVDIDVFVQVVKVGEIAKSKFKRLKHRDLDDIMWLINNKNDNIKAIADTVDEYKRIEFARHFEGADDDQKKLIAETLNIHEDDIDD
ncbi:hypothetical protein PFICI_10978 [Pestalotiopsis fici W106-1]|uniref:Uncharacterized protein n=1 Tax=Pestalotiopsis fici (strain W106-1 / CGMCC3.15140) TaxID=1229662 RepID=W3WTG7_PESFW|nr:uncharacterized protein PFICI_10978 [Pestalotiopsis fici W106-1]ETS77104.1 hypothetical protein PFICI_10978 [Pestalotiopsis fici W106-1]